MAVALGRIYGKRLIEALDLPATTMSVEIRFAADEVVTVRCEYSADDGEVERLVKLLECSDPADDAGQ